MKEIYEITFLDKRNPAVKMDTRRVAGEATNRGFKQVTAWAAEHCSTDEFVGGIQMLACERR